MIHSILSSVAVLVLACLQAPFTVAISDEWCLERGFDRSNLSCDTCTLLDESETLQSLQKQKNDAAGGDAEPIDISAECRACCQSHKVNPVIYQDSSLRGKYKYALLTYNENSLEQYGEVKDFIERDMGDVLSFKGEHRFKTIKTESDGGGGMEQMMMMGMMMGGGMFGGGPPKVMLFEKRKKGGWTEEDEEEAGEVITLRNWKREDIKDMLMTLLPNA